MVIEKNYRYVSHGDGSFGKGNFAEIGNNVVIEKGVLVFHPENIYIGNNIYIGHNSILHGYYKNSIIINDLVWIGQNCFLHGAGGIRIGKAVGIGPMVKILTSMHNDTDLSKPIIFNDVEYAEVTIGEGCDIGIGSILLPGIDIGPYSIIGAGSIVTRDVEAYSVVAGNPAKLLKYRK